VSTDLDLHEYIRVHLYYELAMLLVAATTWREARDRDRHPLYLREMAMDSAFLHARVLYEYLTKDQGWADRSPHPRQGSDLWDKYHGPLHWKLMHPGPHRPYETHVGPGDDLMYRVEDFANDILRWWGVVTEDASMADYRDDLLFARRRALDDAAEAARRLGIRTLFT
jgi:hypothetical protein